jgi:hypothetical protein
VLLVLVGAAGADNVVREEAKIARRTKNVEENVERGQMPSRLAGTVLK